jgi:hypothetical protein
MIHISGPKFGADIGCVLRPASKSKAEDGEHRRYYSDCLFQLGDKLTFTARRIIVIFANWPLKIHKDLHHTAFFEAKSRAETLKKGFMTFCVGET